MILQKYPKNASLHDDLSMAYLYNGDHEKAIASARKAIELEPNNHFYNSNLGWTLLFTGHLDESITYIQKAIEIDDSEHIAKNNLKTAKLLQSKKRSLMEQLRVPADMVEIDKYADNDDWEKVDELCAEYNSDRMFAFTLYCLNKEGRNRAYMAGLSKTLSVFFNFNKEIKDSYLLYEDILEIQFDFKSIMHKFIFKFGDIDLDMINEIYEGLTLFYDSLSENGTIERELYYDFCKEIEGMKKELVEKMNKYNSIRHNDDYDEDEKEDMREELFEGDHCYPFL